MILNRALSAVLIIHIGYYLHAEEAKIVTEIRRKSSHANSKKKSPQSSDVILKRKFPNVDQKSLVYSNNKDALKQWLDSLPIQIVRRSNPFTMEFHDPTLFLKWCERVLGIKTLLKIEVFNYTDYLLEWQYDNLNRMREGEEKGYNHTSPPPELCNETSLFDNEEGEKESSHIISVRGLAASRDIQVGETLISIPLDVLISIPNTIDRDPILSRILGVEARLHYGWAHVVILEDGLQVVEEDPYYELPLLAVAILYHQSLGAELSPIWNYISSLLSSPTHTIPFLLKPHELTQKFSEGVRNLSLRIQHDVKEMYDSVMTALIEDYGEIFGSSPQVNHDHMFSFERFLWAFAIVNSHYWHLPVSKWRYNNNWNTSKILQQNPKSMDEVLEHIPSDKSIDVPPKSMDSHIPPQSKSKETINLKHSFLAPFADLLNFGKPCTHAMINSETNSFDFVAVCPYTTGQEVTFYYSDDCEDIIIANYGFLHPMISKCPTLEDLKIQNMHLKDQVEAMTDAWVTIQNKLVKMEEEVKRLRHGCNCNSFPEYVETSTISGVGMRRDDHGEKSEGIHGRIRRITRRSMEEIGL